MVAAKVIDMNGNEFTPKVLNGEKQVKLTKNGKVKKTPNNAKIDRKTDPIKTIEEIERCKQFLKQRADSTTGRFVKSYAKDLMLFKIGINTGLRVSDLLKLKWSDIFKADGKTFKQYYIVKEKKTSKIRQTYINDSFKAAILEYLEYVPLTDTTGDGYIFTNKSGEQLSDASVDKLMKLLQKELDLPYNLSTHSLRKTFAYHVYINSGKDIGLVQRLLNHSSSFVTLRYIGIENEVQEKAYNELNL